MRKTIVTQFVRAGLCLRAMQIDFDVPVIHICCDPRAVISSLFYPDPYWSGNTFHNFALKSQLLEIDDGREDFFSRWRNEIMEINQMPDVARVAAYYCLTELFVAESVPLGKNNRLTISYEDLVSNGFAAVNAFIRSHGFKPEPSRVDLSKPSASDKRAYSEGTVPSTDERLHGWREVLPRDANTLVTAIAYQLGLGSRCKE